MGTPDAYRHYTREGLVSALIQAEGDIKELLAKVEEFREESERYHQESRDSAKTLGGIIRVLRENGIDLEPAPGRPVRVKSGDSYA